MNKEIAILAKGRITTKIRVSLYHVLLSNTLLDLEYNYINLMVLSVSKSQLFTEIIYIY